jgi:hypothetical protein
MDTVSRGARRLTFLYPPPHPSPSGPVKAGLIRAALQPWTHGFRFTHLHSQRHCLMVGVGYRSALIAWLQS